MTYEELVEKVREAMKKAKVSRVVEHVAFQFNIEGEAAGAFYLEVVRGKVNVEPYEYYDRDIIVVTSANVLIEMVEGRLAPMAAYANEQLKVYGDVKVLELLPVGYEGKGTLKVKVEEP